MQHIYDKLRKTVTELVRQQSGTVLELLDAEPLKEANRSYVTRFATDNGGSLIVKRFKEPNEEYFAERIGLEFLNDFNNSAYPRYLGSDDEVGILVMSDVGKGQTLEALLSDTNTEAATNALVEQVRLVARLHAESLGQQDRYENLFIQQNVIIPDLLVAQSEQFRKWLRLVRKKLVELNLPNLENAEAELEQVAAVIRQPSEFETFTHGDIAPSQTLYTSSGAHLLDFEYSGYRHAFYDVTSWQFICPYPHDVIEKLNETYRRELAQIIPSINDERFYRDLGALCFFILARSLAWMLPVLLTEDKPWAAGVTGRTAIAYELGEFAAYARKWQVFPALQRFSTDLHEKMLESWGEDATKIGSWRAFGGTLIFPSPS